MGKLLQNKASLTIIATHVTQMTFQISLTYQIHLNNIKRIQTCTLIQQRGGGGDGGGDLSVSSDSHLQHLTAAAASRPDRDPVQSQAWCGVTRCRADARGVRLRQMTPELEGRGFKRRRGQMTCMPLGSSKGGRGFFKKGVFELC